MREARVLQGGIAEQGRGARFAFAARGLGALIVVVVGLVVLCMGGRGGWAAQPVAPSGVVLDEADNEARLHLQRADELLAAGRYGDAVDAIRRAMDDGRQLTRAPGPAGDEGFVRYVPLQHWGQLKLCRLAGTAAEALRIYRQQVDARAQRAFDAALRERSEPGLRDVVDQYFASSYGDDALFWLGELAFQRGDMATARECWERISPAFRTAYTGAVVGAAAGGYPLWPLLHQVDLDERWTDVEPLVRGERVGDWLVYPDSDLDLSQIRARLVLVSLLAGERDRAAAERVLFRRLAPDAEGALGGRYGNLLTLLDRLFEQSETWGDGTISNGDWPTFAGTVSRNHVAADYVDGGGAARWSIPLPRQTWLDSSGRADRMRVGEDVRGLLSFHPIVAGDRVVVSASDRRVDVRVVKLDDGQLLFRTFAGNDAGAADSRVVNYRNETGGAVPRFTLAAKGDWVYLPVAGPSADDGRSLGYRNRLVGIDLAAEGKLVLDIRLERPEWEGDWRFEGPPVCDDAFLYVSLQRMDGVRTESHVACFDARRGDLHWRRFVSAAPASGLPAAIDPANNLLALHAGRLFYNTNAGLVAALRADDGRIDWAVRYPRTLAASANNSARNRLHGFRDLNPCLVDDNLVCVAPTDCNRIFALDPSTGKLMWATGAEEAADAVHLLGLGGGNLIASGDALYWFDRFTGRMVARFPSAYYAAEGFARPSPRGQGRGLLAGDRVYWPTREAILVFPQRVDDPDAAGRPLLVRRIDLASRGLTGGNLLMADGTLLVAAADRLYALDAWGTKRDVADRRPASGRETERSLPPDHR